MKKILLICAAIAVTLTSAFAETEPSSKLFRTDYTYSDFTSLAVSSAFQVELTFADSYSVEVEVPEFLEPYLKVKCLSGKLSIGLTNIPRDIQKKLNDKHDELHAWVTMPTLRTLDMSGATRLTAIGVPKLAANDPLTIILSGASTLKSLEASSEDRLKIDMSGASKADITANFRTLDIEVSGASRLKFEGDADKTSVDCSGASTCDLTGNYGSMKAEISGASKLNVDGDVQTLDADASGSSKFEVEGVTAKADVELSGVSKATLTVTERMQYELSGVSTLKIRDKGAVVRGEISRGSKIEYLK